MPIESPVRLTRPIEPASLSSTNLERAIGEIVTLAELEGADVVITTTDAFGRSETHLSVARYSPFAESSSTGLMQVIVSASKKSSTGTKNEVAALRIQFAECRAVVSISEYSGLEHGQAENLARAMISRFPYRDFGGATGDAEAAKLRLEVARIRDDARTELAEVHTANEEAKQLIASQRATLQESTIKHQAGVFKKEGWGHLGLAGVWLLVAIVAVCGLFYVAGGFNGTAALSDDLSEWARTVHILQRVTLLSILATILGVAVRLLRASLHNWVVATHRSNALQAYEAFAAATKDKPGADELLAQALAMTFASQDTGYSKVSGAPDASLLFTEIVKRVPGGKGQT